jgi:hypothetical protein
MVEIQAKIWMALGMVMSMLAAAKKFSPTMASPTVYMWWTQTPKLSRPMTTMEATTRVYPARAAA